jgi:mannose-6-phosphate isomerase-like protein (cupin superfamily)
MVVLAHTTIRTEYVSPGIFGAQVMAKPIMFDPSTDTIGLSRELRAKKVPEQHDPPVPVDGVTFGVATMSENSPHGGEMHPDGDEILYLIDGRARVVFLDSAEPDVVMLPGDGMVVPKGTWHRVDILEPCQIVYVTPGPNNEFRPLEQEDDDVGDV